MAGPVGAAKLSNAATHTPQSAPPKRCDPGVGAGICAPSGATPPADPGRPYIPMPQKVAQSLARRLVNDAVTASGHDRLILFSEIDKIFKEERWAVRKAIRENPAYGYKGIVDGAAEALIDACLEGTKDGDKFVPYFLRRAMDSHPELAAAYLMSAVRILEKRDAVLSPLDQQQLQEFRDHISHSDKRLHRLVNEAKKAVRQLERMAEKPSP
jgi:hypothetical protein